MACFGDEQSANYLVQYLDKFLPQLDCYYDQYWVMPALIWVDKKNKTHKSERFMTEGGLWDKYISNKTHSYDNEVRDIGYYKKRFWKIMNYCINNYLSA